MSSERERDVRGLPRPQNIQAMFEDALELFERVVPERPVLIGGVALAVHGVERYTKDIDFAVTEAQSAAIERAFPDRDPRPLRVGGVSVASRSGGRIDFIDRRFEYRALFEEAISAAQREGVIARAGEREAAVVPLPYLIAMKMAGDRPRDEADLAALLERADLDYRRAREVVHRHLGHFAARRLDRMARQALRADAPPDYENGHS
jgi:hypothetical protein